MLHFFLSRPCLLRTKCTRNIFYRLLISFLCIKYLLNDSIPLTPTDHSDHRSFSGIRSATDNALCLRSPQHLLLLFITYLHWTRVGTQLDALYLVGKLTTTCYVDQTLGVQKILSDISFNMQFSIAFSSDFSDHKRPISFPSDLIRESHSNLSKQCIHIRFRICQVHIQKLIDVCEFRHKVPLKQFLDLWLLLRGYFLQVL